jgi:hypothetical protein
MNVSVQYEFIYHRQVNYCNDLLTLHTYIYAQVIVLYETFETSSSVQVDFALTVPSLHVQVAIPAVDSTVIGPQSYYDHWKSQKH